MKTFTAEDGTKMAFELVETIEGCQRFEVVVGRVVRSITLVGVDTKAHYRLLEVLLVWGMEHFNRLELCTNSKGAQIST